MREVEERGSVDEARDVLLDRSLMLIMLTIIGMILII